MKKAFLEHLSQSKLRKLAIENGINEKRPKKEIIADLIELPYSKLVKQLKN